MRRPLHLHLHLRRLLMSVLLAAAPAAAWGDDPAALGSRDAQRLAIFRLTLMGEVGGVDAATRSAAAGELLGLDHPAAEAVLAEGIASERPHVMRAIFMALAESPSGHPQLLELAHGTLWSVPEEAKESLAILLARAAATDATVIERLKSLAGDPDAPDARRREAIAVLGECRHTPVDAAAALMGLLNQPHVHSPEVIRAATDALARLTGLPQDDRVEAWVAWWASNRDRPAERWLADMVQALSRRVADLEHRQADATGRQNALAQRLLTVHKSLWPLLSAEEQAARLPELLSDDLSALRRFGVARAGVLLRDGNATPQTNAAVIERLDDDDADVRLAVAMLLPELPSEQVPALVAESLAGEDDPRVAGALLGFLKAHPQHAVDLSILAAHLTRPRTRTMAAQAIWVRTDGPIDADALASLRDSVATARLADPEAGLVHLAAALGDDEAAESIRPMLDDEDESLRARTAEALRRRGETDLLLARAHDPAIFPVVLKISAAGGGRGAFDKLAALSPVEEHVDSWRDALMEAARSSNRTDRVEVDQALEVVDGVAIQDRIDLLVPAVGPESPMDLRLSAAGRLVPLLAAAGEDRALMALVEGLPAEHRPEGLDDAAFVAALRSRQFDSAARMRAEPRPWVAAFESLKRGRPELADMVRTEIVRRFQDDLGNALRARLGMASDPLMGDAAETPQH